MLIICYTERTDQHTSWVPALALHAALQWQAAAGQAPCTGSCKGQPAPALSIGPALSQCCSARPHEPRTMITTCNACCVCLARACVHPGHPTTNHQLQQLCSWRAVRRNPEKSHRACPTTAPWAIALLCAGPNTLATRYNARVHAAQSAGLHCWHGRSARRPVQPPGDPKTSKPRAPDGTRPGHQRCMVCLLVQRPLGVTGCTAPDPAAAAAPHCTAPYCSSCPRQADEWGQAAPCIRRLETNCPCLALASTPPPAPKRAHLLWAAPGALPVKSG